MLVGAGVQTLFIHKIDQTMRRSANGLDFAREQFTQFMKNPHPRFSIGGR
jgi:hypothetical protein